MYQILLIDRSSNAWIIKIPINAYVKAFSKTAGKAPPKKNLQKFG